jgi:prolyl 4-hydroxylase
MELFAIRDFLDVDECRRQIEHAEALGFADAPVSTAAGMMMRPDVRNNTRVMLDDADTAAFLWQRARARVPSVEGRAPIGCNERLRYYRYDPGQRFAPHTDGYFERDSGERSYYTLLVYLNGGYEGGETDVWGERPVRVVPAAGLALFFRHHLEHEGRALVRGRKYVLRTDVMFAAPSQIAARTL